MGSLHIGVQHSTVPALDTSIGVDAADKQVWKSTDGRWWRIRSAPAPTQEAGECNAKFVNNRWNHRLSEHVQSDAVHRFGSQQGTPTSAFLFSSSGVFGPGGEKGNLGLASVAADPQISPWRVMAGTSLVPSKGGSQELQEGVKLLKAAVEALTEDIRQQPCRSKSSIDRGALGSKDKTVCMAEGGLPPA